MACARTIDANPIMLTRNLLIRKEKFMFTTISRGLVAAVLVWIAATPPARAQWAVIDAPAIVQLVQEVQTLEQQLQTARDQLTQAKQALETMTGEKCDSHVRTTGGILEPAYRALKFQITHIQLQVHNLKPGFPEHLGNGTCIRRGIGKLCYILIGGVSDDQRDTLVRQRGTARKS